MNKLLCLLLVATTATASALDLFVAPNGNDAAVGNRDFPLRTMEGARVRVRTLAKTEDIFVNFRAGIYPTTKLVSFRQEDGAPAGRKIVYRSFGTETAFIDGLEQIDPTKFVIASGDVLNRMQPAARGKAYVQTISNPAMIERLRDVRTILSFDSKFHKIATWPNRGQVTVKTKVSNGSGAGTFTDPKGPIFSLRESVDLTLFSAELRRNNQQALIDGYIGGLGDRSVTPLVRIDTPADWRLYMRDTPGPIELNPTPRFRITNMLAALDKEGEWFFDDVNKQLFLWPIGGVIRANSRVGLSGGSRAIEIIGADNILFERFVFQHLADENETNTAVVNVRDGDRVVIAGCTFRNIASPAPPFSISGPATNCALLSCDIYDNGRGGGLSGGRTTPTEITLGRNRVENCHFTMRYSDTAPGGVCGITGAGNVFRNNLMHESNDRFPVSYYGNDHVIEFNEMFNLAAETTDVGSIYIGNAVWAYGTQLRNNFVHHVMSVPGIIPRAGFFSDDFASGQTFDSNVFYKAGEAGVKVNKGSGMTITNNVFLSGQTGVSLLGRPAVYEEDLATSLDFLKNDPASDAKPNYLGRAEKFIGDFVDNATGTYNPSWDTSFWAKRYPALRLALSSRGGKGLGMFPSEFRVYNNAFNGNEENFRRPTGFGTERDSVNVALTNFTDPAVLNFKFRSIPGGMKDIPFERIGLFTDAYRVTVPDKNNYRRAVRNRWEGQASVIGGTYNSATAEARIYYNSGDLILPDSQRGLSMDEADQFFNGLSSDVGDVGLRGNAFTPNKTDATISAAGDDIGGTADSFRFTEYDTGGREQMVETRVAALSGTTAETEAGVMIRENRFAGSKHVSVLVGADGQVRMAWRLETNRASAGTTTPVGGTGFPKYVRLVKATNSFTGFWSRDGVNWTRIARIDAPMGDGAEAGIALASGSRTVLTTGTFFNINAGSPPGGVFSGSFVASDSYLYDLGPENSPLEPNYRRLTNHTEYGYVRWADLNGLNAVTNPASPARNLLNQDLIFSNARKVLSHQVENGTWNVLVTFGDSVARADMRVWAEGSIRRSNIDRAADDYRNESFDVTVTDGVLNLEFESTLAGGSWAITRINLTKTAAALALRAEAEAPVEYRFDFGTAKSPLQPGWTRVTPETRSGAYRWLGNGVQAIDRGNIFARLTTPLHQDFIFDDAPATFQIQIPNGKWKVTILFGDIAARHDNYTATAEGISFGPVTTTRNFLPITKAVTITDGTLDIQFSDKGGTDPNWAIQGISLER